MTQEQMIHIGMINSFNVITGKNTMQEILNSDVSLFAHAPDEDPPFELFEMMIDYFSAFEMFEKCVEIVLVMEENFNRDGTRKEIGCECTQPLITEYSRKMFCGNCKKRLKK